MKKNKLLKLLKSINKKGISGTVAVLLVATIVAFNVNVNSKEKGLSDISLANIEALADESGSGSTITGDCEKKSIVYLPECHAICSNILCGKTWYPNPRVPHADSKNLRGHCSCGHPPL